MINYDGQLMSLFLLLGFGAVFIYLFFRLYKSLREKYDNFNYKLQRVSLLKNRKNLPNQNVLAKMAKYDEYNNVRLTAVEKLVDQQLIVDVALNAKNVSLR